MSGFLEKYLIPEVFSPNVISIVGQIPGLILIIYVFTQMDMRMDGTVLLPSWVFYTFSACIQWFDMFDNADGVRARRLNCGSPVGRIVDEALDLIN